MRSYSVAMSASLAGAVVGRYTLFDEIARGGMASVHVGLLRGAAGFSRVVAIKRLLPHLAGDEQFVEMFVDEGLLAARIEHPNVVSTLDVVRAEGELFIVMQYVAGESLSVLLRKSRTAMHAIPHEIAVAVAIAVLRGLAAAHGARGADGQSLGVVHRDVSPHNILIGVDGISRLADFGVAKANANSHVTREGQLKGKLLYMAPEVFSADIVTQQADVYGLAVVLWEMLTGQPLFRAETEAGTLGRILEGKVPRPSQRTSGIDARLDDIVMQGLSRALDERYANAEAMADDLATLGAVASQSEISRWVESLASASIQDRSNIVKAIENGTTVSVLDILPREASEDTLASVTHVVLPHAEAVTQLARAPAPAPTRPWTRSRNLAVALGFGAGAVLLGAQLNPGPTPAAFISQIRQPAQSAGLVAGTSERPASSSTDSRATTKPIRLRNGVTTPRRRRAPSNRRPKGEACADPFIVDADGIKRPKPGCVGALRQR